MKKYIFFLGGHDAEMKEIRNILKQNKIKYFDKKLSWGAKSSNYRKELAGIKNDEIPVLVELETGTDIPENTIIIDHHNYDAMTKKTSIEQTADLLGLTLTRKQKLISANDSGYIRGMKKAGASDDEIREIRNIDRKAQGITDDDEAKADESVKHNIKTITDNTIIVKSLTNRTACIFDRLFDKYTNIFVYTPDGELNFSGEGWIIEKLISIFENIKLKNKSVKYWFGGSMPGFGYFGSNKQIDYNKLTEIFKV